MADTPHPTPTPRACPQCDAPFACGPGSNGRCWCDNLPAIIPLVEGAECLCPACLKKTVVAAIALWVKNLPDNQRLNGPATRYATEGELIEDIDYTLENGFYVFSEWYHLKRGSCCHCGCRHCPYRNVANGAS